MIPFYNVAVIAVLSSFMGFILGMVIFASKHDYEQDFDTTCSSSKHLFPHNERADEIYCFCGQEVIRPHDNPNYLIIKT